MGQACIAGSRLFVSRAVYEPFMEKLTALTQQLIIGDPRQERVHVGPLISPNTEKVLFATSTKQSLKVAQFALAELSPRP